MFLNLSYDSSVSAAPNAFKAAMNYVANYFNTLFTNPVTVTINVGWGEVNGQLLDSGALGASMINLAPSYTYSQILSALANNGAKSGTDLTALSYLTTTDPTHGGWFSPSQAAAKALGLLPANSTNVDGWIGFDSTPGTFNFDTANRASPGLYDFVGVAFHEITEVMGRVAGLSTFDYSVLDLFRYSSTGVHQLMEGRTAYFSLDGGSTNLDNFNTRSGGDYGDWAASAGNDAFLAFGVSGVINALTTADIAVMDAIGWNTVAVGAVNALVTVTAIKADYQTILRVGDSDAHAAAVAAQINTGQISRSDYLSQLSSQARDTTAAVESIYQFMAGKTLDAASLDSQVHTITQLISHYGAAVGWNGIGASLADSNFAPQFASKYENLGGDDFISAVTSEIFGAPILNTGVRDALNIYIEFYSDTPNTSDPTGEIRGKGYFVADMMHQASDIHVGDYQQAVGMFLVGLANGTTHYGDSLFV